MTGELKRVRYEKSPLVEVIFQLQFPTILSINSGQPVELQEKIRSKFPFFEEALQFPDGVVVKQEQKSPEDIFKNKNFTFISEDRKTRFNLTASFIALSTAAYTQWEDFRDYVDFAVPFFEEAYRPAFYARAGLRYIDVITRMNLGLQDKQWDELIQPHVLGMAAKEHGVKSYVSETEYETREKNVLTRAHVEFVHVNNQTEISLLLDCDYYTTGNIKLDDRKETAERLHNASSHFVQTSITKELEQAMQPVEI